MPKWRTNTTTAIAYWYFIQNTEITNKLLTFKNSALGSNCKHCSTETALLTVAALAIDKVGPSLGPTILNWALPQALPLGARK